MVKDLMPSPLRSGTRQRPPHFPLLFNRILEVLANEIRQEKEIKAIVTRKEDIKLSLFAGDRIIYIENPREHTHTQPTSEFSKSAGCKINIKYLIYIHQK